MDLNKGPAVGNSTQPTVLQGDSGPAQAGILWSANFDGYANGMQLHGVDGWKGWDNNPAFGAVVSNAQSLSNPHSVDIKLASDLVRVYNYGVGTGTQYIYTAWIFVPTAHTGQTYFLIQNRYNDGGPYNWSVQVGFNSTDGLIHADVGGSGGYTLPFDSGVWREIRVEIDFILDQVSVYYNNIILNAPYSWTKGVFGADTDGLLQIGSVDLYANNTPSVYYDDLSVDLLPEPTGSCCDDDTTNCADDQIWINCQNDRFTRGVDCADLAIACGDYPDTCTRPGTITLDGTGFGMVTVDNTQATVDATDPFLCDPGAGQGDATVWYRFTAHSNFTRVRTCGSAVRDTAVALYDDESCDFLLHIACGDDSCGARGRMGEACGNTTPGQTYLIQASTVGGVPRGDIEIVVESYDISCPAVTTGACCSVDACRELTPADCFTLGGYYAGDGTLCIDDPCPSCDADCQQGESPENETCGTDDNGGCNRTPPQFTPLAVGETVCGVSWSSEGGTRDTDWFRIVAPETGELIIETTCDFPFVTGWVAYAQNEGSGDCADVGTVVSPAGFGGAGQTVRVPRMVEAGKIYWGFVAAPFNTDLPCCSGDNNYTITLLPPGCVRNPDWVCDGDVDGNGAVNPVDQGLVQAAFGSQDPDDLCQYDIDCNGVINPVDSGLVQSLFGTCNPPRDPCD
jgi:hypothetical protein